MTGTDASHDVIRAAEARAAALAQGDAEGLTRLLHEDFRWTSHTGATFEREEYVARNTGGRTTWHSQELAETRVVVVGETAVLFAEAVDVVGSGPDGAETFRMPMTQVWVRQGDSWRCLAGHAGPRRAG